MAKKRGFTLLEILVVIAIIGLLMGLLVPTLSTYLSQSREQATETKLQTISTGLSSYNGTYGDYPPTYLGDLSGESFNQINRGSESLTACLMSEKREGPWIDWPVEDYSNTDDDRAAENITGWYFGDNQLREMTDVWGNPIIYIHHSDYGNAEKIGTVQSKHGSEYQIEAALNPETSAYRQPHQYQIWSMGANQQNNNGSRKDVIGW